MDMTVRAEKMPHDGTASPQDSTESKHAAETLDAAGGRPLRRDAERNRQRILAAAAAVFTERGLDATLDDVARAAGVGVGTVYRRFPDKESLIAALFRDRIDTLVTVAEEACAAADPWAGLVSYLEFTAGTLSEDLALRQLVMFGTYDKDQVCYVRDRMHPVITRLVERAQASGDLREDFAATDVKMIAFMLASIAEYAASVAPGIWRRYLAMLLDGLRPARPGTSSLPVAAPSALDLGLLLQAHGRRLHHRH
jgi:AcrR family transcriptional regulator